MSCHLLKGKTLYSSQEDWWSILDMGDRTVTEKDYPEQIESDEWKIRDWPKMESDLKHLLSSTYASLPIVYLYR